MGDIITFRTGRNLDELIETLDLAFGALRDLYEQIDVLEEKIEELQQVYNAQYRIYSEGGKVDEKYTIYYSE